MDLITPDQAKGLAFEKVLEYAWKNGLFVIVPSGDSVTIADKPHDFRAREW